MASRSRSRSRSPPAASSVGRREPPDALSVYYDQIFPWGAFAAWQNCASAGLGAGREGFSRREFSFTLRDDNSAAAGGARRRRGIVLRNWHFQTADALREEVRRVRPCKFDIGALSLANGDTRRLGVQASQQQKELVFDIDLTGYDGMRVCCSGDTAVCEACWVLVTVAIKILDAALRQDFGFVHVFWVFSGRRGVHCWVCDRRARALTNIERAAIVDHLRLPDMFAPSAAAASQPLKENTRRPPLHPTLWRAYKLAMGPHIQQIIAGQNLTVTAKDPTDRRVWQDLSGDSGAGVSAPVQQPPPSDMQTYGTVFRCFWPRLDVEVTKQAGHLLKAPWAVHPKTGKICVPIDPQTCDQFNPNNVPTVEQVFQELQASFGEDGGDYEQTSLRPYVDFWRASFLDPLLADSG